MDNNDGWTTVKKKPRAPKSAAPRRPANPSIPHSTSTSATQKRHYGGQNRNTSSDFDVRRLDDDDGTYRIKKVSPSKGKAIAQARQRKGLTQKQLANQIQEQISVVQSFENGRAVPNQKVLAKMRKVLGGGF
eukprot:TRINITY_DN8914_c0_g1_i1.p1 TRINITY_DN8914_c0_g1~~TRINITY_DN8914_c0_g1_i1.p1  ORF type:complete len:132 (-),score=29.92 TRINITY_DN8914_c0_g1_i1:254-649(-)